MRPTRDIEDLQSSMEVDCRTETRRYVGKDRKDKEFRTTAKLSGVIADGLTEVTVTIDTGSEDMARALRPDSHWRLSLVKG